MSAEVMDRKVGGLGYGLMGLTWRPNPCPEEQAFAAMRAALNAGCNLWNGGEFYGPPARNSLMLLNRYYAKYPEDASEVVLNIKGGIGANFVPDGSPEGVRRSVENCVEQLGPRGRIDMFECARKDPKTPIEVTMRALGELVEEGKIGGIALSEVNANTIRQAAKLTKIAAVEIELSLFSTDVLANGVAKACAELNIPILAYSPMSRGILTGQIKSFDDIPEDDFRKTLPRFQPENFVENMKLVEEVQKLAKKKNCTNTQLAIGWVRSLSKRPGMPEIIPIPGATTVERVKENSVEVLLDDEEMKEVDEILEKFEVKGNRYMDHAMQLTEL